MEDELSFVPSKIPYGRSGSTRKGGGIWQLLVKDFLTSGVVSAKVDIGDRNFRQVYASISHAIKVLNLQDAVRVIRRIEGGSVYLQLVEEAALSLDDHQRAS